MYKLPLVSLSRHGVVFDAFEDTEVSFRLQFVINSEKTGA